MRLGSSLSLIFLFCVALFIQGSLGLNNGLGLTPAMAWSTWNLFQGHISDELIRGIADGMVSSGLAKAGYEYINIDDGWAVGRHPDGTIIADPALFPNGMKALVDYIHSKGLKMGIYTSRGSTTCMGRPGSLGHEKEDAQTYASWGVDYLKHDTCGNQPTNETQRQQYEIMRDGLNATGRPIYYSICELIGAPRTPLTPDGAVYTPEAVGGPIVKTIANSWLVEYVNMEDAWYSTINGGYRGLLSNLDAQQNLTNPSYSSPGGWNDMDMMECCNGGMTNIEYTSHFSLWSILASPLILSNDLRKVTKDCLDIIGNAEVIAVDQDPLGMQGRLVHNDLANGIQIFTRPLKNGSRSAVLFNRSEKNVEITLAWQYIQLPDTTRANVRDLWQHKDLGVFTGTFTAQVVRHGVVHVNVSPVQ